MAEYPATSHTLISRLNKPQNNAVWQESWQTFVLNYRGAVESSVMLAFAHHQWSRVSPEILEEVVSTVFISFFDQHQRNPFDPEKGGRVRSFIKQLAHWRVVDYIRAHLKTQRNQIPLDQLAGGTEAEAPSVQSEKHLDRHDVRTWTDQERLSEQMAFQRATVANLLYDVSRQVSPRSYLFFCEVKMEGKDPQAVANEYQVGRHIVDNDIYKVMTKLRELARHPDYRRENQAATTDAENLVSVIKELD